MPLPACQKSRHAGDKESEEAQQPSLDPSIGPLIETAERAGITCALALHLQLHLTAGTAAAALKASWIACNIAGGSEAGARSALPVAPLLIAHLGGGYGADLVVQCAWTLGNLCAWGQGIAEVLMMQGFVPALLQAVADTAKTAQSDVAAADAAAGCTWALATLVQAAGRPAANALIAAKPGGTLGRVLCAALSTDADAELRIEAAWLLAHIAATGTPSAQQLCGAAVWPAVHSAAIAALRLLCLQDEDAEMRWRHAVPIVRALGNLLPCMSAAQAHSALHADDAALPRNLICALQCATQLLGGPGDALLHAKQDNGSTGLGGHDRMETPTATASGGGATLRGQEPELLADCCAGMCAELCWLACNMAAAPAGAGAPCCQRRPASGAKHCEVARFLTLAPSCGPCAFLCSLCGGPEPPSSVQKC